jgi:hypothetical protein
VGTATYITDPGSWNWNCNGNLGGSSASCSATNIGPLCAALPSGLIDWWPADDNTNDIVGGNSGVINGTVGYAAGETGQAFSFSGAGGVSVTMPSLLTTNGQVTVSFWMKWNGTDGQIPFNFNPYYDLWFMNGTFGFNTGNDEVWGIGSSGMANRWIQVTAVFTNGDPHNNQLYLNGVQQTLTQRSGTTPTSAQVSTTATIGNQNNRVYYFNGLIDSVQVYNGALTQAEIQSIYDAGAAGVCTAEIRTTTTVSSSENPANTGDTVTLTATVVPNFATGTVTFMDGSTSLGTGTISG